MKKIIIIFILFAFIFVGCGQRADMVYNNSDSMSIYFPELRGKCILINATNETVLIDCGTQEDYPALYSFLKEKGIQKIDCLIISQTDNIHMGAAQKLLQGMSIKNMYMSDYADNIVLYKNTLAAAANSKCKVKYAECGTNILNNEKISIDIVSPVSEYSVGRDRAFSVMLSYCEKTFFFEGDCGEKSENDMINSFGDYMKSDVLSVSDCGSKNASSPAFLQCVSPKYAVISVAKDKNITPDKSVLQTLDVLKVKVIRTDCDGDVEIKTDGKSICVFSKR